MYLNLNPNKIEFGQQATPLQFYSDDERLSTGESKFKFKFRFLEINLNVNFSKIDNRQKVTPCIFYAFDEKWSQENFVVSCSCRLFQSRKI